MSLSPDILLAVYGSVLHGRSALYCSAPITSGYRFVEWVRNSGADITSADHAIAAFPLEHQRHVVQPNLAHAREVIERLRLESEIPIIDPTSVPHITAWIQVDWLRFWEKVIGRFAIGMILLDDWQYSFGCAHEFVFAQQNSIPTFDETGNPIDSSRGRSLIEDAILAITQIGGSTELLLGTLTLLESDDSNSRHLPETSLANLIANHTRCTSKTRSSTV